MRVPSFPQPGYMLVIAIASVLVLIFLPFGGISEAPITLVWQKPLAEVSSNAPPTRISGEAIPAAAFDLVIENDVYIDAREQINNEIQQALGYTIRRFGSMPSGRIAVRLVTEGGCGLHGIAYTDIRSVQVFSCPAIGRDRAVAILAHEFVHQLAQDRYGPAHLQADLLLAEGLATWGAGTYWLGDHPDFRSYVREQRRNGVLYPLATSYEGRGVAAMNVLYYQWASFVDYLIGRYGRERFDQVYVSGHGSPGSANYMAVYGKGLDVLEREWLAWLDSDT